MDLVGVDVSAHLLRYALPFALLVHVFFFLLFAWHRNQSVRDPPRRLCTYCNDVTGLSSFHTSSVCLLLSRLSKRPGMSIKRNSTALIMCHGREEKTTTKRIKVENGSWSLDANAIEQLHYPLKCDKFTYILIKILFALSLFFSLVALAQTSRNEMKKRKTYEK